ncbi:TetR/AcrR family transcriptional regulator [Erythrobacter sp. GH1-10]|uniref:TetR/AcrR family transcriptional regulator n=1 Tax=Erythrobacter sp. GH1-10 TaxID=3349334 RepID=UPI0038782365
MEAAIGLFRAKGFAAVSLDDLSEATGLSRPSLYRAFGDKLSMYLGAMDSFASQVSKGAMHALKEDADLELALTNFYRSVLSIYFRDDPVAPGCLVYGTAPGSADLPPVKLRLSSSIQHLDDAMRQRIGQSFPNAPSDRIEAAEHLASNTLIAFSARAKAGASMDELADMGGRTARAICQLLERDAEFNPGHSGKSAL